MRTINKRDTTGDMLYLAIRSTVRVLWPTLALLLLTGGVCSLLQDGGYAAVNTTLNLHFDQSQSSEYPRTIRAFVREGSSSEGSHSRYFLLERVQRAEVPVYTEENVTGQLALDNDVTFNKTGASYTSNDGGTLVSLELEEDGTGLAYIMSGILVHQGREYNIRPKYVRLKASVSPNYTVLELQPIPPSVEATSHNYVISEKSIIYSISDVPVQGKVPPYRRRRDVMYPTTFTVDVLAVVDSSVYRTWRSRNGNGATSEEKTKYDIRQYYSHVFTGVDLRFSNIDFSEFQLRIKLVGIIILSETRQYPWTVIHVPGNVGRTRAEADAVLGSFRNWVNETTDLPSNDHAILFTGYDLFSIRADSEEEISHTSGLAFIGTLCGAGDSVSIVEEPGGFQGIATTTHEIAHSLGALHDGENNTCNSSDRYIMAASGFGPVPQDRKFHPWQFSSCSLEYFRSFIAAQLAAGSSCLLDSEGEVTRKVPKSTKPNHLPGQQYSPDEQCRLIWGPGSYMCRGSEFGTPSTVCTSMYCRDPATNNDCVLHTAARGTSCGDKQWCIDGKCVSSRAAPSKTDTCVHGDQPGIAFNGMTCARLVSESASYCYQDKVRARCCESCGNQQTFIRGCEYGDRVHGCRSWHCTDNMGSLDTNVRKDCCQTCSEGLVDTRWTAKLPVPVEPTVKTFHNSVTNVGGCNDVYGDVMCSNYVAELDHHVCYSMKVAKRCCKTCQSLKSKIEGCEYGDRTPTLCRRIANITDLQCGLHGQHCCQSCDKPEPRSDSTSTSCNCLTLYVLTFAVFIVFR